MQGAKENWRFVINSLHHLAKLSFIKCFIKELCLFPYLFPSCWDGKSCRQRPPWYQPTWKYLAKRWPMSTSIRKSCNKLWRYQGPLLLFARFDTIIISYPHLLDLYLLTDDSRTCWQKHSDEENCQPDPQWNFRAVDTASVDGRAAIYCSQLPRPAAGVRVIHHGPGTCCSQRWVGEYEVCCASSEQGLGGTGWERPEKDVEEKNNWFL